MSRFFYFFSLKNIRNHSIYRFSQNFCFFYETTVIHVRKRIKQKAVKHALSIPIVYEEEEILYNLCLGCSNMVTVIHDHNNEFVP